MGKWPLASRALIRLAHVVTSDARPIASSAFRPHFALPCHHHRSRAAATLRIRPLLAQTLRSATMGLRSTRSAADSRVSLVTADADVKPSASPGLDTPSDGFTSLRRATRSTTRTSGEASSASTPLDLSKYSYEPRKRVKRETVKDEVKDEPDEPLSEVKPAKRKREASTPKKEKAAYLPARGKAHPEPPRWKEQYALIERMRAGIDAPVDTMYVYPTD